MKEKLINEYGELLTVEQVAEIMQISKQTVRQLIKSLDLKAVRFGRTFRVPQKQLGIFIEKHEFGKVG